MDTKAENNKSRNKESEKHWNKLRHRAMACPGCQAQSPALLKLKEQSTKLGVWGTQELCSGVMDASQA